MKRVAKYAVFKTKWGFFGILGTEKGLLQTCLPMTRRESVKSVLFTDKVKAEFDRRYFQALQEMISAYFEGCYVDFNPADVPITLDGFSGFSRKIYSACRDVKFGQKISYGQLAEKAGSIKACRAVGNCMAHNKLPLIVPCHRVVRSDGRLGGFSGSGGVKMKKKLLGHERKIAESYVACRAACNN